MSDHHTLDDKTILVTGGTGSFGQQFIKRVLADYAPRKIIVFSRDELKQFEMQQRYPTKKYPTLRYFIGDVRDRDRLYRAFKDVDVVVHAAAMKQVPACEYNPVEAVKTNIMGAANVIDAAIDCGVPQVLALSSDKAANPLNLYGASKLCSDKLFVAGNFYSGVRQTRFSIVRYGNVLGSRGSVIPFFLKKRKEGVLPITDERMTRFWITLDQAVDFVLQSLQRMRGGEVFVPKLPSMRITDLAKAIAPECELRIVGIRAGEKLHEVMIPEDDARSSLEFDDQYVILPTHYDEPFEVYFGEKTAHRCADGFRYSSDNNTRWLTLDELRALVVNLEVDQRGSAAELGTVQS